MRIRALGTGHLTSRHPVTSSSFLLQSESATVVFGCGPSIPAKLEAHNISLDQVDIWAPLHSGIDQMGGLEEIAYRVLSKQISKVPFVAVPQRLAVLIEDRLAARFCGKSPLPIKATQRIHIEEEHHTEVVTFVPNYGTVAGYGLAFDEAEVFISGDTELNEDWLHSHGMDTKLILHVCRTGASTGLQGQNPSLDELQALPIYLQKKIWLYGQEGHTADLDVPLPMLYLPQTWFYDGVRKLKHLDKERFIREGSKRQTGHSASVAL